MLSYWRGEEGLFWRVQEGGSHWDYLQEYLVHERWKVSPFVKFEIILPLLYFLLNPLTNKCPGHGVYDKIVDGFRDLSKLKSCSHQGKGLINTFSFQKKTFFGNMMLSHWPCYTWKFFMIWFRKIPKVNFQKPWSSPRNICTEHILPHLTAFLEIFLSLKKENSVEDL